MTYAYDLEFIAGVSVLCVMLAICMICLAAGMVNRNRGKKLEQENIKPGNSMLHPVTLENLTEKKKFAKVLDYYRRAADYCVYAFWFLAIAIAIAIAIIADNFLLFRG